MESGPFVLYPTFALLSLNCRLLNRKRQGSSQQAEGVLHAEMEHKLQIVNRAESLPEHIKYVITVPSLILFKFDLGNDQYSTYVSK